jgi:NAD(P)-dependent dehydrogenase (short-subunit alcohol dehydrogenase family)
LALLTSSDNNGGNTCYRLAKCALNQLTKTQAKDLKKLAPNVITLAVHPGYVATKMTGFYGEDDMDECMEGFTNIVEKFGQKGEEERIPNGGYVRWNGEKMNY